MTNNDILRSLRYTFDFSDSNMATIFNSEDITRNQLIPWLKKEDDEGYQPCNDRIMALFLNGFINERRGKKEGVEPKAEIQLNNNIIFMKLKIALNLKAEDILAVMESVDFRMSKHELSAFFRTVKHKHYRECKDQILRNFLKGIQLKYRENQLNSDL